ncbi:MAG: hypothetical protein E7213_09205 [Clostridium sp.]|nr:hypothetical protein [Clostridium sp.]
MNFLFTIIYFVLMFIVAVALIILFKKFLFSKVKINKYIPLAFCVAGLIYQLVAKSDNFYINAGLTVFIVVCFAWYFDINQTGGPKKAEKKIVMKPKAKPNRIKNEHK